MRAINHALTGAVIGASISNPIALPLSFISHFILDSLPHWGNNKISEIEEHKSMVFKVKLIVDFILCLSLVLLIFLLQPKNWVLMCVCAFLAASPDLFSIPRFKASVTGKNHEVTNPIQKIHRKIQWGERNWGFFIELPYFVLLSLLLASLI